MQSHILPYRPVKNLNLCLNLYHTSQIPQKKHGNWMDIFLRDNKIDIGKISNILTGTLDVKLSC